MKKLSLSFALIGILFLSYGLYQLFNLSDITEDLVFYCIIGGFISCMLFLITDKISEQ